MRFLIAHSALLAAITKVGAVTVKSSSNPVLGAILIESTPAGITLIGTDKALTMILTTQANVEIGGKMLLDAANLKQVIKVMPADTVSLTLMENQKVEIKAGRSKFGLNGLNPAESVPLPTMPTDGGIVLTAAALRKMIDRIAYAIAPDDNRYGLNGAHLDSVDTPDGRMLRMVGTDGNRLSWAQAPFTGSLAIGRRMLLPRAGVVQLRALIDGAAPDATVTLAFAERAAVAKTGDAQLHMRLLEAEFPNYKEVLPTNFKRTVTVARDVITDALRRVSVFATDTSHSVRFAFSEEGLVLTARKLDAGDAREEAQIELAGEPITMGFNARFLQDAITASGEDTVTLDLGDALAPCIVRGQGDESYLAVVMPVRLD